MRIGVQTWGSDGDIRPLIALAGGLRSAGHDVTVAVTSTENRDYSSLCQALDLSYARVPEDVLPDMANLGKKIRSSPNRVRALQLLIQEVYLRYLDDMAAAAKTLCSSSDLVIGHFSVMPLKVAALRSGTPFVSVILFRGCVPSLYRPPGRMPDLGPLGNFLEWKGVQALVDFFGKREVRRLWRRHGLVPPRHVLPEAWSSSLLNLISASRVFCGHPPDWGTLNRVCGYFWLPAELEPWEMPRELQEFLDSGDAPVYMTFGLLQPFYPEINVKLMKEAAQKASCRAIIQTGSEKYPPNSRDGDIYFVDRVPHHHIFPRCAAVAYHGGGGTAHSVTLSGRPSVTVGFSNEHMANGNDLYRLGAASKPIRYRAATPHRLAAAIRQVLDSPQMLKRAAELGGVMRREGGVRQAVEYISQLDLP